MATDSANYAATISELSATTLNRTSLLIGKKYTGKVRDVYETRDHLVLITTDRQSAFDRLLACVPFKGHVLNMTSAWWFKQTQEIVPNHVISTPHPNVTIARKCTPFRVEFVVRAYLTGTTSTSVWVHYKRGSRSYCGHSLPDGA
jgi:phosphoribosylaminoimidazole-succinocarboxamide synthase